MAPFGTPRRLAGMMLLAPRRCRMCWWLASESNSASASTTPIGAPRAATSSNPGRERASHPGPCRARCANKICCCTSTTISHFNLRTTRPGPVGVLLQAPVEESADRSIGEPGAVDGRRNGPASAASQPTHGFLQSAIDGIILQPPQKTIQRGVVGHRPQSQCGAQLVVLAQAYFGFAKSPVFVAHQAQHRQQLRLGEPMFAEATAVGWQNLRGHLQRHASKGQESDLGHRPSCSIRKHRKPLLVDPWLRKLCRGCQQSPTLMDSLASVANKRLTARLSPLDSALTKNRGVAVLPFGIPIFEHLDGETLRRTLLSLFAPRVFHNSFAIKGFHTLSQKCRVSPPPGHPFLKYYFNSSENFVFQSAWECGRSIRYLQLPVTSHKSPVTD